MLFLALRMLQSARVAGIFTTVFPWQPVIQYITLANFWLDGKLQWGSTLPHQRAAAAGERDTVQHLAPQLVGDDQDEVEAHRNSVNQTKADAAAAAGAADEQQPQLRASAGQMAAWELEADSLALAKAATEKALADEGCLPLYIATSFRPIPTPDEVAAVRQQEVARKALLEELKRARAEDREKIKAQGGLAAGLLGGSTRLWRAGWRHQKVFFEEPDENLFRRQADGQKLEQRIAHAQFRKWREQQMAPLTEAEKRFLRGEKLAVSTEDSSASDEDGFRPVKQLVYGDRGAEELLALARARRKAALRAEKKAARDAEENLRSIERERRVTEAKLAANATAAAAQKPHALPPLKLAAAAVPPPLPGQGVRKKAVLSPPAAVSASVPAAPSAASAPTSHGASLPLHGQGVLDENDDFVSESSSHAMVDNDEPHSLQPSPRNMFLATPREA
jgi:hypothetical protein